jgi:DNA-binding Xre family transcriptional regulator
VRGPSQNILYDKKQCLSIYCVSKDEKPTMNTICSSIAYISTKSIKIKLDKEKAAMLWKKISEKLSEKNWTVYKLCLKAGIGPAGIYRLRDGEVKDLYFDTVKKIADALEISIDELR